jgi:hypothetical protein
MAMVLLLVGLLSTTLQAAAQQRFLNTKTTTKYAAIGLVKEPLDGVTRVIGAVKRSEEPLMQQTEKWEARCDNGVYARACVHVALRSFPLIAQSKLIHVYVLVGGEQGIRTFCTTQRIRTGPSVCGTGASHPALTSRQAKAP